MTADYAALEARVAELEQQIRHMLPARIDAVAYGLSIVHEDLRAFRSEMVEFRGETRMQLERQGEQLDRHGDQLGSLGTRMDRHGELLEAILRRLPPAAGEAGQ
jgi:hypothetical protein